MNALFELGISETELKNMLEVNNDIVNLSEEEIKNSLLLLKGLNCNPRIIRNIITANPIYLSRSITDLTKLINKIQSLGITRLDITFDSNPWLLNKDDFEIDDFIKEKSKEGLKLNEIIDLIDSGMTD